MKKSKIILIVLAIIVAIPVVIVGIILSFVTGAENYQKEQDKYFEKVEYYFSGQINSVSEIIGGRYIIELNIDSASFIKNNVSVNDNFFGLYSEKYRKIFFIGFYNKDFGKNGNLPYVIVNSSKRTIEYVVEDNVVNKDLILFYGYDEHLKKIETKDMIRF